MYPRSFHHLRCSGGPGVGEENHGLLSPRVQGGGRIIINVASSPLVKHRVHQVREGGGRENKTRPAGYEIVH